jgi:hypothetical protein
MLFLAFIKESIASFDLRWTLISDFELVFSQHDSMAWLGLDAGLHIGQFFPTNLSIVKLNFRYFTFNLIIFLCLLSYSCCVDLIVISTTAARFICLRRVFVRLFPEVRAFMVQHPLLCALVRGLWLLLENIIFILNFNSCPLLLNLFFIFHVSSMCSI